MSMPGSWMTTAPFALTTLSTSDLAPSTVTCFGSTSMTPTVSPVGGTPCSISTGTVRWVNWSSWMFTYGGLTLRIWIRASAFSTWTGRWTIWPLGSIPVRSTKAVNEEAVGAGTSVGAK